MLRRESSVLDENGFDLKVRNLKILCGSNDKEILSDIGFHINAGQLTAIIGASGAGKTTLINFLSGQFEGFSQFEYSG